MDLVVLVWADCINWAEVCSPGLTKELPKVCPMVFVAAVWPNDPTAVACRENFRAPKLCSC